MENLKSYQSAYATLTAEITANLSKIGQNLKLDHLPEDSVGEKFTKIISTNFSVKLQRFIESHCKNL